MSAGQALDLRGVPETSLWTLYNRAHEATRRDAILRDPECVRIFNSIDYDFARSFGPPDGSHALRSWIFDEAIRPWLLAHPGGTVIELGSGLETQFQRVDDGQVRWHCIDLPEVIQARRRLLRPSPRCVHIEKSALDLDWIDAFDGERPVFISAQGLLMYFPEESVRRLLTRVCAAFPGSQLMFDTVPPWLSRATRRGLQRTEHYRFPVMPWGINRRDIKRTLHGWSDRIDRLTFVPWAPVRGVRRRVLSRLSQLPLARELVPAIVRVRTLERGR